MAATPTAFRELARHHAFAGKMTNPPCFAPPYALLRNLTEAVCIELPLVDD